MKKVELAKKIRMAVEALVASENGCSSIKLDDNLAICVGWSDGFDTIDNTFIHSKTEPNFCLMAGIKVWTSDDLRTDYDWINFPYLKSGEVLEAELNIRLNEDYKKLAEWLLNEYENLKASYEVVSNDGLIIEKNKDKGGKEQKNVVNYYLDEKGTLKIFVGNCILAEIEDGEEDESFVEDILNGMGYIWNEDGTLIQKN